jgi:acyl-CoA thioesterase-1
MGKLYRYVALGDSTAVGVGAAGVGYPELIYRRMKALGWPAGILNLGQSGSVSADVVRGQLEKAISVDPDLITVGIGGNDLWRLVSPDRFRANLLAIADGLARTRAHVVVSNLIDLGHAPIAKGALSMMSIPPAMISARVREFNKHLQQLASRPRTTVVDLHSLGELELSNHPEFFSADGFHPSEAGYQRWADLIFPAVEDAHAQSVAEKPDAAAERVKHSPP